MIGLLGLLLVAFGYYLLFNVPLDASPDSLIKRAIAGELLSIAGALLIMLYIFLRTR